MNETADLNDSTVTLHSVQGETVPVVSYCSGYNQWLLSELYQSQFLFVMFKLHVCTNKNHSYKHNEQINNQNIDNSECFGVKFVKVYPEMTLFVLFLLAIVLSVFLRFAYSDYP
jgi:hypothetical protein